MLRLSKGEGEGLISCRAAEQVASYLLMPKGLHGIGDLTIRSRGTSPPTFWSHYDRLLIVFFCVLVKRSSRGKLRIFESRSSSGDCS
jgi:hypothetical protein